MIQISKYSSINFSDDWKLPFQQQVEYIQKFKPSDQPRVQYSNDPESTLKPFIDIGSSVKEISVTTLASDDSLTINEFVVDLSEVSECSTVELFFADSADGDKSISAVFLVDPNLEDTVLVEYTHRRNDFETIFDLSNRFCFRVEGCFLPQEVSFDNDTENFRDQRYKSKTLSSFPIEKKTLSLGGGFGVPNWTARLINNIFSLSNVYVDGERMVRSDGSSVEITLLHNDYPLYIYKMEVEATEDEDTGDLLSLLRVVDSKKKIARSTGDSVRVYNTFAKELGISDSRMIRELETVEEIGGNFYIELDDNVSSNTGKATLRTLQQFIFDGWIDQPVRTTDNVQFKSVKGSKGSWGIGETGDAKFRDITGRGMTLSGFLEVPELRYNQVRVYTGVDWQTFGGGVIASVEVDKDSAGNMLNTGTITLKLEPGQIGAVAVDDLCVGIFHNYDGGNDTANEDQRNGNFRFAGFCSVYFRITEITESDNSVFRYALRGVSENWTWQHHPSPQMNFACYANPTNKDRQSCKYSTTEYSIGLWNMTTWEYGENNIYAISGILDGFSLNGKDFEGTGVVIGNGYFYGTLEQISNAPVTMEIDTNGDYFLAYGETITVTCKVFRGWEDITAGVTKWGVVRDSGDPAGDAAWQLKDKAKNFAGTIDISLTKEESDLGPGLSTLFTFTAEGTQGIAIGELKI